MLLPTNPAIQNRYLLIAFSLLFGINIILQSIMINRQVQECIAEAIVSIVLAKLQGMIYH